MNTVLPNPAETGALRITELFDFFDGPKLFVCENAAGHYFLGYWIGTDQIGESYLIVPISEDRYLAVRSGIISLRDAISRPELGYVLQCRIAFANGATDAVRLAPSELAPDLLPDPDEVIKLQTETLPVRMDSSELSRRAVANQREVLALHFQFPGSREEGPTRLIGKLLVSTQDLLDALGQKILGMATLRGVISSDILLQTETRLARVSGASFAVEILAARQVDLFANSLISDAIREFLEIVDIGNDVERLRDRLLEIKPRATSKYGVFLNLLLASESPVRLEWASPERQRNRSVSLDLATAAAALKTVEQTTKEAGETRTVVGRFIGVELPRRFFILEIGEDDDLVRGRISDSAMGAAEHLTLNHPYRVTIRETIEITASGEEKVRFEIEDIATIE